MADAAVDSTPAPETKVKRAPKGDNGFTVKLSFDGYCDKLDKRFPANIPVDGVAYISPWLQAQLDAGLGEIV